MIGRLYARLFLQHANFQPNNLPFLSTANESHIHFNRFAALMKRVGQKNTQTTQLIYY